MRAFLNGKEIFLDKGRLPAIRLSAVDLTDINKVRGNTSSTINVVSMPQSRNLLGDEHAAHRPQSVTNNVFTITDDGGQDVYVAKCAVVSATRDKIEMVAVSGNAYWIEWAKKTKLRDLVLTTNDTVNYNGRQTPVISNGISVQSNVLTGLIEESWTHDWLIHYPLVDYGSLKGSNASFRIPPNTFRPGVRLWKLLEASFAAGGFALTASNDLKSRLSKLILITGTEGLRVLFDPDFQGMASVTLANGGNGCGLRQTSMAYNLTEYGASPSAVGGLSVMYDTQGRFTAGTQRFTLAEDCELIMRVRGVRINIPTDGTFINKRFRAVFWDETDGYEVFGEWSTPVTPAESIAGAKVMIATSELMPMLKDHVMFFSIQIDDTSGLSTTTVTVAQTGVGNQVCVQYVVDGPVDQFYTNFQLGIVHRIIVKNILPDMTVADLVSSTVSHQGLCVISDERQTELMQMDVFLRTDPLDITDWIDYTISPKKTYSNIGAVRYRWKEDGGDELLNRISRVGGAPGYGNSDVVIGSGWDTVDVALPFAATAMDSVLGGKMLPAIRKDGGAPGVNSFGISTRLLCDGGVINTTITIGTSNTYYQVNRYPFTYFVRDGASGTPMAFGDAERHWCSGYLPNTSDGVLTALHQKELTQTLRADTLELYVAWPAHWLKSFDFGRLFSFMDGLSTVNAYVNEIECASMENRYHRTKFVVIPGKEVALKPYVAPPPFVCSGAELFAFTVGGGGSGVFILTGADYLTYRYQTGAVVTQEPNMGFYDLPPGSYCAWPSDANADIDGGIAMLGLSGPITAADITGLSELVDLTIINTALVSLVIPAGPGLTGLLIEDNPALTTVIITGPGVLHTMSIINCALSQNSVDGILEALASGTETAGAIYLNGGANAAPGPTGLAAKATLEGRGWSVTTN